MQRILVAGATSVLGRTVVAALRQQGKWVRVLSRSATRAAEVAADDHAVGDALDRAQIAQCCDGIDAVFSCLGQSVGADLRNRGPGYMAVDYPANMNLLDIAQRAGVQRFVYVSAFGAEQYPAVAYFRAHADVAREIRASGLSYAIMQPTGFFSAFRAFFDMAVAGQSAMFGSGTARTNPIHDADLADVCVETLLTTENGDIPVGGPQIYTRREVLELAFGALNKPVRITRMPAWMPGVMGSLIRPFAPRIGELAQFLGVVSAEESIAPVRGSRELAAYFAECAAQHARE